MATDDPAAPATTGYVVLASALVAVAVPLVTGWSHAPLSALSLAVGCLALVIGVDDGDDGGEGDEYRTQSKTVETFDDRFA